MGVGRGGRGAKPPLDFENFSKKGCFLSFEWENQISPLLAPPCKNFGRIPWWPTPGKNPSDSHAHNTAVTKQWTTEWPYIAISETFGTWQKTISQSVLIWCYKIMVNKVTSEVSGGAISPIDSRGYAPALVKEMSISASCSSCAFQQRYQQLEYNFSKQAFNNFVEWK